MDRRPGSRAGEARHDGLILADTSAWIEFLRRTNSHVDRAADALARADRVAITEPVKMELLAGALTERAALRLAQTLAVPPTLTVSAGSDFVVAARLYRTLRRAGHTMRNQLDCLIAAVAIRNRVPLLHNDADFDLIAQHAPLEIYAPA